MADTFVETVSGRRFDFDRPTLNRVWMPDVAHALSQQCRFAGHTAHFYSVAQHCLNVRGAVGGRNATPALQIAALLHDAAEAFVCDLPSPVKHRAGIEGYRELDHKVTLAVVNSLYLRCEDAELVCGLIRSPEMKQADIAVTLAERAALLRHNHANRWEYDALDIRPASIDADPMAPGDVCETYLRRLRNALSALRGEEGL